MSRSRSAGVSIAYAWIAIGVNCAALAVSPCSSELMIRSWSRRKASRPVICDRSGGPPPAPPANGALAPAFWPAGGGAISTPPFTLRITHPTRITLRMPAKIQGPLPSDPGPPLPPTGSPHRWQNLAPAESSAWQRAHSAAEREAPHPEQNLPLAGAPQWGQWVVGIGGENRREGGRRGMREA